MYSVRSPYAVLDLPYYMPAHRKIGLDSLKYHRVDHPLSSRQTENMMRVLDRYAVPSTNEPSPRKENYKRKQQHNSHHQPHIFINDSTSTNDWS